MELRKNTWTVVIRTFSEVLFSAKYIFHSPWIARKRWCSVFQPMSRISIQTCIVIVRHGSDIQNTCIGLFVLRCSAMEKKWHHKTHTPPLRQLQLFCQLWWWLWSFSLLFSLCIRSTSVRLLSVLGSVHQRMICVCFLNWTDSVFQQRGFTVSFLVSP